MAFLPHGSVAIPVEVCTKIWDTMKCLVAMTLLGSGSDQIAGRFELKDGRLSYTFILMFLAASSLK